MRQVPAWKRHLLWLATALRRARERGKTMRYPYHCLRSTVEIEPNWSRRQHNPAQCIDVFRGPLLVGTSPALVSILSLSHSCSFTSLYNTYYVTYSVSDKTLIKFMKNRTYRDNRLSVEIKARLQSRHYSGKNEWNFNFSNFTRYLISIISMF